MMELDPAWDRNKRRDEADLLAELTRTAALDRAARERIVDSAAQFVDQIRSTKRPGLMEVFLAEYGLSTDEGVALMCLAEALLRVPDAATIDALIEDKIAPSDWSRHVGHSASPLVNASTWGLLMTGKILTEEDPGVAGRLRAMVKRLGEPLIRTAVSRAMREMGRQFILGQDIDAAIARARELEAQGFTYSYDMLGEAAMTAEDARRYADAYARAIDAIAGACTQETISANPGISIKLSALHPRYEVAQSTRVMDELIPIVLGLARQAARAGIGLNIDAEEMDRLGLSMKIIEAVIKDPTLSGWTGFGVVVQAYGRRAGDVISGLYDLTQRHDRRIMIRLVKGAYWDTEIKHAQVEGLDGFPVFTRKAATDVSFLAHARTLLGMTDRIYPQFATHNAHTVAAVLEMAQGQNREDFEFQRLHGMGEALHKLLRKQNGTRCRIYAPVGAHRDLLAYLVRRLLENGANSSFVNRIVDEAVPARDVVACPFQTLETESSGHAAGLKNGPDLFAPERVNSRGYDLTDTVELQRIHRVLRLPDSVQAGPILAASVQGGPTEKVIDPTTGNSIGSVTTASAQDVATALDAARIWPAPAESRCSVLNRAADLYEDDYGTIFALLGAEAGKTLPDAVAELREAVDFLRFYAAGASQLEHNPRGIFTCISPWNFPLAIFTGQIAAALAAGNAVLAKPAETTPAIAAWGVEKLHAAGVPREALQFLPGHGGVVGQALTSDPRVNGVAFTGSTYTACRIQSAMAESCAPGTPLIAETGGLNAMVVDSTALPEQAVRDIIASAFQSAGQRCSALRCLYVQEDIAPLIRKMLIGAMNELRLGVPAHLETDVGPVITAKACRDISAYIDDAAAQGRLIHRLEAPETGTFVAPALIAVSGIEQLTQEVFGPVLHFATFRAAELGCVIEAANNTGFGLTFGLHTRIDDRVQTIADTVQAGNIYANRNQIGAIVGSQPFGGEGLSGTGPKAGGPHYLARFTRQPPPLQGDAAHPPADAAALAKSVALAAPARKTTRTCLLPGPTGELNRLAMVPRQPLLCLGPGPEATAAQQLAITGLGGTSIPVDGRLQPAALITIQGIGGALWWGDLGTARAYARALAERPGPIIPLITDHPDPAHAMLERHLCVDTTAAGGNATLLAGVEI